jgi:hypothetical protein
LTSSRAAVIALFLAGCASLKNTPQQDLVWEMGKVCEGSLYQVTRVEPDGRYWVQGASNVITFQPFFDCMEKERAKRQPR